MTNKQKRVKEIKKIVISAEEYTKMAAANAKARAAEKAANAAKNIRIFGQCGSEYNRR